MTRFSIMLLSLVVIFGCASGSPDQAPSASAATEPTSVPDSAIGLARGTAFEQPAQAPIVDNPADPGESSVRPRPNPEFPPVIPHSVAGFAVITRDENACVDCHAPAAAEDMGAIPLPESHMIDLRRSPDTVGEEVAGSRWVCTACHVAQTEGSPPLVAVTDR